MAGATSKLLYYYLFFLSCLSVVVCSGTLVGFSYDARRSHSISSPAQIISFLKRSKVFPSQIRVAVADYRVLNAHYDSGVLVDLYLNETEMQNLRTSEASAISWFKAQISGAFLRGVNIRSIVVGTSSITQLDTKELLHTLETIHSVLKSLRLDDKVKVSPVFSLSELDNQNVGDLHQIIDFISKSGSFVILETKIGGELSMGDQFIRSVIKSAISAATAFHDRDVPIVLNVKSSAVPSSIEVAQFSEKMINSMKSHLHILDSRVSGIFAEISPMLESEQKELNREEEQMFDSSRRELISNPISAMKLTQHDNMNPQGPLTIPSANPTSPTVTVPSINPGAANTNQPTSPMNNPVVTTPILVPSTNPGSPPTVPAGNPVPTPITVPSTTPPANPGTNNPMPPAGTVPITPPSTTPTTNPLPPPASGTPSGSGQWCVAKPGASETALQAGIDYACGIADCSAIQPSGSCYNPNTRQNHASYAFNSYYQKNPSPLSCDFKGAATLTNANPTGTGSCVYPSSGAAAASGGGAPPASVGGAPPVSGAGTPPAVGGAPPGTGGTPTTGVTPAVGGTPSSGSMPTLMPPPFSLNSSIPGASGPTSFGTGFEPPSGANNSVAAALQPLCAYIVLASSLLTGALMMDV